MEQEKKTGTLQTQDQSEAQKRYLYWKQMVAVERQFYDYVLENTDKLLSYNPPRFVIKEDSEEEVPPSYIRYICKLKPGMMAETKERLQHLRELHKLSQGELFTGRHPSRFARIYSNVEQINISTHDAYKSWRLKATENLPDNHYLKDCIIIKTLLVNRLPTAAVDKVIDEVQTEVKGLSKRGLAAEVSVYGTLGVPSSVSILVKEKDLYRYLKTQHIQARKKTGTRYNARIRHVGESASTRHSFGFILIDENSPLTEKDIYQGPPQARRSHRLEVSGAELAWPHEVCRLDYQMYDKSK